MVDEWRQIREGRLTPTKLALKRQMDADYATAVRALTQPFYQKKRTVGVTPQEEQDHRAAKQALWNSYVAAAKAEGLYELITTAQQLAENADRLGELIAYVNNLRGELGMRQLTLAEI